MFPQPPSCIQYISRLPPLRLLFMLQSHLSPSCLTPVSKNVSHHRYIISNLCPSSSSSVRFRPVFVRLHLRSAQLVSVSVQLCPSPSVSVLLHRSLSVSAQCPSAPVFLGLRLYPLISDRLCPFPSVSVYLCCQSSPSICLRPSPSISVHLRLSPSVSVCLRLFPTPSVSDSDRLRQYPPVFVRFRPSEPASLLPYLSPSPFQLHSQFLTCIREVSIFIWRQDWAYWRRTISMMVVVSANPTRMYRVHTNIYVEFSAVTGRVGSATG